MKPVVKVRFSNGAGNNIFQYVYARLLSNSIGGVLSHPDLPVLGIKGKSIKFNSEYPVIEINGSSKNPVNYHQILKEKRMVNYDLKIYPEDFTLYTPILGEIRSWFSDVPRDNTLDLVFHLRLGDRLIMSSTYKEENFVSIQEFRETIDSFDFRRLHIVTDMPVWRPIFAGDVDSMVFHRGVKPESRIDSETAASYFNTLYDGLMTYNPVVRVGNSVQSDFDYMRKFDKILFQHGTLSWWAAALSFATDVALLGRWRGSKNINLGWTDLLGWRQWGRSTAPSHELKDRHLAQLAKQHGLRTFVETGTRGGAALEALSTHFDKMYSVELVESAYQKVKTKLRNHKHIKLYQGDSAKVLPEIMKEIKDPTLFWLDAHDGRKHTPILEEIKSILPTKLHHVIAIDDLRYFGTEKAYPSVEEVTDLVKQLQPSAHISFKFDSIRIML